MLWSPLLVSQEPTGNGAANHIGFRPEKMSGNVTSQSPARQPNLGKYRRDKAIGIRYDIVIVMTYLKRDHVLSSSRTVN